MSKEEREAALMQPLCELILDWSQKQWLDDINLTLDNFTSKVKHLRFIRRSLLCELILNWSQYWLNYWHIAEVSIFSVVLFWVDRLIVWDEQTGFRA